MLNNASLSETILGKIVDDKLSWIADRKKIQPLISFKDKIIDSDRDFYQALSQDRSVFILECKKASPSKGLIRRDFDLDLIASIYKNHADVISVLTDEKYFQGNLEFITKIRAQVTQPVICKDFIVDPYQIYLARYYQADAILLMLSVLDDDAYKAYMDTAHSLHMGVLTEVSNEDERLRAIALNAKVIGINNRNLRDLSIDLNCTKELAVKIPTDRIVISESGINTHHQVKDLSRYANGFLVGSSIMSQDNIEFACRRLILGENKVCGLTEPSAAKAAYHAGAIYGGLIFVKASKRCVDIEQARKIIAAVPLLYAGVFQNETPKIISMIVQQLGLSVVQLHGDESPLDIKTLRTLVPSSCQIWKAHSIVNVLPDIEKYNVDKHLLDTRSNNQSGGTGQVFDWSLLIDTNIEKNRVILAGGLSPENAQQAALIGCAGLDFNSGLESAPGIKDTQKINAAFSIIKHYQQRDQLQTSDLQQAQKVKMEKTNAYFGQFGGMYVPQILVPALKQLEAEFLKAEADPAFIAEFSELLTQYAGRPTPLTLCRNLTQGKKTKLYLKREDLLHGGAHKTNQVLGQALLAKRMGKTQIIAETGAGQHGVATAIACALLNLKCKIYMGAVDMKRQEPNVFRMRLMGAQVIAVNSGSSTLKDACNQALRDWAGSYDSTHYLLGTAAGPHPFPTIVREFQKIIGEEAREQCLKKEGVLPNKVIACVGGGSNAIGIFCDFIDDVSVELIGVEPGGKGIETGKHGCTISHGSKGIFFGMKSLMMQDENGQVQESYSISAGLDFPSVGPQHSYLAETKRAQYVSATDQEALIAFKLLAEKEGIIPALESAHALAHALKIIETHDAEQIIIVNLSGRGDKDIFTVAEIFNKKGMM